MKQIRLLAQYYVDLMVKLGLVRFSILLASALVVLAMIVQMAVTMLLRGEVESIDVVRSIFFGLLITPWAVYFLSVVVEQLEESRQRLARLVDKLEEMRNRDLMLNQRLQDNIAHLNKEIADREKAEDAGQRAMKKLTEEMAWREQAQIELEQQSSLLRSFLDASPDLVYYRNENKEFSGCNRAMELLVGKSEKQLIGLTPRDVYGPDIAEKVIETDEKVFRHNVSLTYEQWLVYPDGRRACFELRKVPFYDRVGKRHGLMGFGRDITERKRYQDALENASREKTTFISTISHELRTPLNGIVGLSRILLDTDLDEEQLAYLKTIHVSAITLGNIFNDIIEMDKMERRHVQLDNQPLDFSAFLIDLKNLSGLLVQPKGLKLVMQMQEPLPDNILADGTRLRQILWNLIGNAVKFTQQGQIVISIRREGADLLCFDVQDSGIGIPEEEQDKIFGMYYQVRDQQGGKPATGTGIGLAVSKRLAQAMGGDIRVKSHPGQGACFSLTIVAPEVAPVEPEDEEAMPLPALNVLLVEDIELNVVVARSVLEKMGSSVDVAMNGHDALAMFDPDEYDLVLLDIQLPDMTGLDISRQLRQRYRGRRLPPLIALTANVLKDKKEYLDAGMDDVLSKPLAVSALADIIKKFWDHPGSASPKDIVEPEDMPVVKLESKPVVKPEDKPAVKPVVKPEDKPAVKPVVKPEDEPVVMPVVKPEDKPAGRPEDTREDQDAPPAILDITMLEQYLDLVGPSLIHQSLALFEKMMPGYLDALSAAMAARDQHLITEEGHKIKGAAGSVGLLHLQQLAQKIQSSDLPAWWDHVQQWVNELQREWLHDVQTLQEWAKQAEKK